MFEHILIPLDGSKLSESSLPAASHLAQALNSKVTLIHIIEKDAPSEIHKDRHLTDAEEANTYLQEVASRTFPPPTEVDWHVHMEEVKDVAKSIVLHTEEIGANLVVMCTHGRGGMRDWLMGSIAQQVISFQKTPVLLIPPRDSGQAVFPCRLELVALDGIPDHEGGLTVAVELGRACNAALHLLRVIPTRGDLKAEEALTGKMLPTAMAATLDLAEEAGKDYLAVKLAQVLKQGVSASAEVARGDALTVIVETVERTKADLIVLGTHGKTGLDAFFSGSVTPRLSGRSEVPLLLVPVHEQEG